MFGDNKREVLTSTIKFPKNRELTVRSRAGIEIAGDTLKGVATPQNSKSTQDVINQLLRLQTELLDQGLLPVKQEAKTLATPRPNR